MELVVIYLFMGALAAYALYLTFRGRNSGVLVNPTLGFLTVGELEFAALLEEDRAALAPLFSRVESASGYQIPQCDVLFMYANIQSDGSLGLGADVTLRHAAERAGAAIAVLASSNASENISAAAKLPGPKRANLVWTFDRNGGGFSTFFKELFTQMKRGKPMPRAWVSISPQFQSERHRDLPKTMCQMEAGQVRFR
jgi:hypothetical protein